MAKVKGFDIEKWYSFDGETISARTQLYEFDDIFWLGQAYRRAATEAYPFCVGSRPYQAARKNKHDRPANPYQKGNQHFAQCVQCWNSMVDTEAEKDPCSGKRSKEYYWNQKKKTGVKCSYIDVFLRECLKYWAKYRVCPPFCCDLQPNIQAAGACCGQKATVCFSSPVGPWCVTLQCGGFPGTTRHVVTHPLGYKGCVDLTCIGPKPGKTWYPLHYNYVWHKQGDPFPQDYTAYLQSINTFPEKRWFRVFWQGEPNLGPEQYFVIGPGGCIGPYHWTWPGTLVSPGIHLSNCDGTTIDADRSDLVNIFHADFEGEC